MSDAYSHDHNLPTQRQLKRRGALFGGPKSGMQPARDFESEETHFLKMSLAISPLLCFCYL